MLRRAVLTILAFSLTKRKGTDGDGVADLAIPSRDRRSFWFIAFKGGVRELARKELPSPAASDFSIEHDGGRPVVVVGLQGGRKVRVGL